MNQPKKVWKKKSSSARDWLTGCGSSGKRKTRNNCQLQGGVL